MKNTFKPMLVTALMLVLLFTSYVALANEYGSKDDPLVSLSYIKEVLMPETLSDVESVVDEKTAEYIKVLDEKVKEFSDDFDIAAKDPAFVAEVAEKLQGQSVSSVITITEGETLELSVGSEMILRSGDGLLSSGFLNVTIGQNTLDGEAVSKNNLYVAVEEGKIFTPKESSEIIVFGNYNLD